MLSKTDRNVKRLLNVKFIFGDVGELEIMKMLYLFWGRFGGCAKYAEHLLDALIERNDLDVYPSFSEYTEVFDLVKDKGEASFHIKTFISPWDMLISLFRLPIIFIKLFFFIKKHKIDTVFIPMQHIWALMIYVIRFFLPIKVYFVAHEYSRRAGDTSFHFNLMKFNIKVADKVVVLSKNIGDEIILSKIRKEEDLIYSKHGIITYSDTLRKTPFQFTERPLRLLFIGKIIPYKGLHRIIEAVKILSKESLDIRLEIYGKGDIAEMFDDITNSPNIMLDNSWLSHGDIDRILSTEGIVVCPYSKTSQSGVIPMVYAYGLPVIATNVNGINEQVFEGETGLFISEERDLCACIRELYNNQKLCQTLSEGTLKVANSSLSWKVIADEMMKQFP